MPDRSAPRGATSADTTPSPASPTVDQRRRAPDVDPAHVPATDRGAGRAHEAKIEAGSLAGQATAASPVDQTATAPTPFRRRRPSRSILTWLAIGWLVLVVLLAVLADVLPLPEPNEIDVADNLLPPFTTGEHLLGTDGLGRDLLSRVAYGGRVSLTISVAAVAVGLVVGGILGMVAGFFRGRLEGVSMAVVNVILAYPPLVLLLAMVAFIGQSLTAITLIVGFLSIPIYARVARATTLTVSQREYVLAARAMGATNTRILFREIMPNVILPVAAFGLLALGVVIVLEGTLAFLGLSVEPPDATWGSIINEGRPKLKDSPHLALIPSLVMFLTVLSINFVGDSLRSRFDVKESGL